MTKLLTRFTTAIALAGAGAFGAGLLACGPLLEQLDTVQAIQPAHRTEYARGDLGIVRPRFARRYLVHAYRRLSGSPVLANGLTQGADIRTADPVDPIAAWQQALGQVSGLAPAPEGQSLRTDRRIGDSFQWFENCPPSAFSAATRALQDRIGRYGASSVAVRDWATAQRTVFLNCADGPLMLPDAARPNADASVRADRAYQVAAAHFYGMQYEQAAQGFRAIAEDSSSPWRSFGRYLAARATLRLATVPDNTPERRTELLTAAERDLRRVAADPAAASLHASARRLIDFAAARLRPVAQLHALSRALSSEPAVTDQQVVDYQVLFDWLVGDTVDFDYASVKDRVQMIADDDLTDWVLAMQGGGSAALDRAVARWKATQSVPWLVATLWKLPPAHADAQAVLKAAAELPLSSPAYPTTAFLRVRLLAERGDRDEARAVLTQLPPDANAAFQAEAINLLKAERFRLARTLEDLLANATRTIVSDSDPQYWYSAFQGERRQVMKPLGTPVLDVDAALVLSYRLPLDRAVEAATATTLPDRLALRVAVSAFTRAALLGRYDVAKALAPRLRSLAPKLAPDLQRLEAATTDDDRRIATLRLLLRTPGMRPSIRGLDDSESYTSAEPAREFEHMLRRNWWCGFDETADVTEASSRGPSPVTLGLVYPGGTVTDPEFLTPAERAAAKREQAAIAQLGNAPDYLATEAVTWATSRPKDLDAAEALAHGVEGARWTCEGQRSPATARRAFDTLHRLFPQSEWAKKTKYWY